jgi:hypothetical protein
MLTGGGVSELIVGWGFDGSARSRVGCTLMLTGGAVSVLTAG